MGTRNLESWRGIARAYSSLESESPLSGESKAIAGHDLQRVMEIVNTQIEDPLLRRKISATFQIRTKYQAIGEILNLHLVDDPDLAVEIAEAAGGADVDRGGYLTS